MKLTFPCYLWLGDRNPHPHIIPQLVNSLNKGNVMLCQLLTHLQTPGTYTAIQWYKCTHALSCVHKYMIALAVQYM